MNGRPNQHMRLAAGEVLELDVRRPRRHALTPFGLRAILAAVAVAVMLARVVA